jgi:predicted DNA-binding WGR domain protein
VIHNAILQLYSNACTVNGDTKDTITVKDSDGKDVSINWTDVENKAQELRKTFDDYEKNKTTNKTSAITKLKTLGLTDDEITALVNG